MSMQPELRDQETQADALLAPPSVQQIVQLPSQQPIIEEHAFKQTTTKRSVDNDFSDKDDDLVGKVGPFARCFWKRIKYWPFISSWY